MLASKQLSTPTFWFSFVRRGIKERTAVNRRIPSIFGCFIDQLQQRLTTCVRADLASRRSDAAAKKQFSCCTVKKRVAGRQGIELFGHHTIPIDQQARFGDHHCFLPKVGFSEVARSS